MARQINRLTARSVATLMRPGRHADGAGLYLSISRTRATVRRRWVMLYRWNGRLREMGLGGASLVPLAEARSEATRWRRELRAGRNPIDVRAADRRSALGRTFGEVASAYHAAKSPEWRSAKVREQWRAPLETYARQLMSLPVNAITTDNVLEHRAFNRKHIRRA